MNTKEVYFKYHPKLKELDELVKGHGVCQCCGESVEEYYSRMYCEADIDCLCLPCIHDGKAAEKFHGDFIQDAQGEVSDKEKTKELFQRTPGYHSWQGEYWLTCCDDYCAFLGSVGTKELEEMGICDQVIAEYEASNAYQQVKDYLSKDGSMCGYLFRCIHCGAYHLGVDAD